MPTMPPMHKPPLAKHKKAYNWQHTKKTTERGYGAAWRKLRGRILMRDKHLCQPCKRAGKLTQANEVDHIQPKAKGGTDEPENLQAICTACHKKKTSGGG